MTTYKHTKIITHKDITNILNREITTSINNENKTLEITQNLSPEEQDKIIEFLYPEQKKIPTDTTETRLTRIEKLLGIQL